MSQKGKEGRTLKNIWRKEKDDANHFTKDTLLLLQWYIEAENKWLQVLEKFSPFQVMAMNKSTGILVACVLGLSIACVGLLIALSLQSDSSSVKNSNPTEKSKNLGSPVISGKRATDIF